MPADARGMLSRPPQAHAWGALLLLWLLAICASALDTPFPAAPAGWTTLPPQDGATALYAAPGGGARLSVVRAELVANETGAAFSARNLNDLSRLLTDFLPSDDRDFTGTAIGSRTWQHLRYSFAIGPTPYEAMLYCTVSDGAGWCATLAAPQGSLSTYVPVLKAWLENAGTSRAVLPQR